MPDPLDCLLNDHPVCPHCGAEMGDAWDLELDDGDSTEVECGGCEREYTVACVISVAYTTRPVEGWPDA